jgi:hypothetical protein
LKLKKSEIEKNEITQAYENNLKTRKELMLNKTAGVVKKMDIKDLRDVDELEEQEFGLGDPEKQMIDTRIKIHSSYGNA